MAYWALHVLSDVFTTPYDTSLRPKYPCIWLEDCGYFILVDRRPVHFLCYLSYLVGVLMPFRRIRCVVGITQSRSIIQWGQSSCPYFLPLNEHISPLLEHGNWVMALGHGVTLVPNINPFMIFVYKGDAYHGLQDSRSLFYGLQG